MNTPPEATASPEYSADLPGKIETLPTEDNYLPWASVSTVEAPVGFPAKQTEDSQLPW